MLHAKSCRLGAQANIAAVFGAQGTVKQLYDVAKLCVFIFPNPLNLLSDTQQQPFDLVLQGSFRTKLLSVCVT